MASIIKIMFNRCRRSSVPQDVWKSADRRPHIICSSSGTVSSSFSSPIALFYSLCQVPHLCLSSIHPFCFGSSSVHVIILTFLRRVVTCRSTNEILLHFQLATDAHTHVAICTRAGECSFGADVELSCQKWKPAVCWSCCHHITNLPSHMCPPSLPVKTLHVILRNISHHCTDDLWRCIQNTTWMKCGSECLCWRSSQMCSHCFHSSR